MKKMVVFTIILIFLSVSLAACSNEATQTGDAVATQETSQNASENAPANDLAGTAWELHMVNDPLYGTNNVLDGRVNDENSFTVEEYIAKDKAEQGTRSEYGPFGFAVSANTSLEFHKDGKKGTYPVGATRPIEFAVRNPQKDAANLDFVLVDENGTVDSDSSGMGQGEKVPVEYGLVFISDSEFYIYDLSSPEGIPIFIYEKI